MHQELKSPPSFGQPAFSTISTGWSFPSLATPRRH